MRPFTTLARPFVAAPFIMTGLDAMRDPRERAERVAPAAKPVADRFDWLPKDPESLVRMQGALSVGTGALLLTGRFRRLTTLLLAAQVVPAMATEHRYWTVDDPDERANERAHLLKNAGLFGALLMVAAEPRRAPRLAEVRRAARETQIKSGAEARALRREAAVTLRDARREAARQVRAARAESGRKAAKAGYRAGKGAGKGAGIAQSAKTMTTGMTKGLGKGGRKSSRTIGFGPFKAAARSGTGTLQTRVQQGGKMGKQAGKTVKAGTSAQAQRAMKAGQTVKAGTAVQAGKVKQAVKR
ncbi:DoxX family protein [Actinomadura sp. WMMB 499]|uniref:DoxX family protein n=1 Tax=Actinomadura sp. WMMB 499 TaxID=1219491 RepID=UPI0012461FC0|nr:DoxX family membrane protein [Actinomadura sp. WMMB 499]QFG25083.1 DoxX family membrane protein [Actinomadura sp. WMMB 499]